MTTAKQLLDNYYLEMRWRCLSLAADLDRIGRAAGGGELLKTDPRIQKLKKGFDILLSNSSNRAEQFQMVFSDMTPPPQ